ncbi:hypothetical protein AAY473_033894, partial [Plecturocebus cupreus]
MWFYHVGQAGLKPLTSGDLPTSTSQSAGIIDAGVQWRDLGSPQPQTSGVLAHLIFPVAIMVLNAHEVLRNGVLLCCQAGIQWITATSDSQFKRFPCIILLSSRDYSCVPPCLADFLGDLAVLAKLECSGMLMAHCGLDLLGAGDSPISASKVAVTTGACQHAQLIFVFFVETRFCHVTQTCLEFLGSNYLPTLAFQSAGIT